MSQADSDSPHDVALDALIAECADALRHGKRGDCLALIERHPEHAAELSAFLDDFEHMERRFAPLRELSGGTPVGALDMPTLASDGAGPVNVEMPKAGQTFGDYELLAEVARGGMGVVYEARQKSLNRIVALKMVLGGRHDSSADRARFAAEAKAVARLNHPHIVPIYEVGERGGHSYFTMKYFSGGSLREQVAKLRDDSRAAARLMATVARAVEHAHRRGILHRDLKPTNVLLDERGEPHVADFGLAKQLDEQSDITQAGAIIGTPSYMAPEQANAATDLTTAADVYGLGAVLYELLTGRPPFKGETPLQTILATADQEPTAPRKLSVAVPADLETICLKCLRKKPLDRYRSAEALADDLERWLDGKPIEARPVTATERLVKWSRRQPLLAGSLATVGVAALGLLVLAGFLWQNAEARAQAVKDLDAAQIQLAQVEVERGAAEAKKSTAEKLADEQRRIADAQKLLADKTAVEVGKLEKAAGEAKLELEAARSNARRTLYSADMMLAHAAWQNDNIPLVADLLEQQRSPPGTFDLRGFEWHYLWRQLHGAAHEWTAIEPKTSMLPVGGLALSPDGRTLATATQWSIRLWNVADGKLLKTERVPKIDPYALAYSAAGDKLVLANRKHPDGNIHSDDRLAGPAERKEKFKLDTLKDYFELHVWNWGGDQTPEKILFDPATLPGAMAFEDFRVQHEGRAMSVMCSGRSPDGKYLALAGGHAPFLAGKPHDRGGKLIVCDLTDGEVAAVRELPTQTTFACYSPDGKKLALGHADGTVTVADALFAGPIATYSGHRGKVTALEFSGNGSRLFSGGVDGLVIVRETAGGKPLRRLRGHRFPIVGLAAAPSGEQLISGSQEGNYRVWNMAEPEEPPALRGHSGVIRSIAFSADGRELISVDDRCNVLTWDPLTGARKREVKSDSETRPFTVELSRDGGLLAWSGPRAQIHYRASTGGETRTIEWNDTWSSSFDIAPGNDRIVAGNDTKFIWRLSDGLRIAALDPSVKAPSSPTFSPDGKSIAAGSDAGLVICDAASGLVKNLIPRKELYPQKIAFSPDGQTLAVAFRTDVKLTTGIVIELIDLRTKQVVASCRNAGRSVYDLVFSPDGKRLASSAESVSRQSMLKLWDTATGRETFSVAVPQGSPGAPAFSPDGRRLAAAVHGIPTGNPTSPFVSEVHIWNAPPEPAAP